MKKETSDLQSRLKPSPKKHSSLKMMEHFFQSVDLNTAKDLLNTIMQYAVQKRDWINEDLSVMVHFHQSMRSFIRAGYFMRMKAKKWMLINSTETSSPLMQGFLSDSEYQNPLLVFHSAFIDYRVKEFDYFLCGMVYFSLGAYRCGPEKNMVGPYIHLMKMLDAGFIILERRKAFLESKEDEEGE
ncbi:MULTISPECIES: hypothetical protein [Chryseobacterium]|uniref:Uncharacterized protein n=1 Tax=Chryseobacterium camelliae TaxID=1265445 RepID=A0ABU0THS9_9FLAO|nr:MULTISPECIES: hypothetical protein [Chryseobacterium]MDT3409527.1 hypothetical protein [Pseudacidovorax intermedius]MDQ1096610.1 hypothetical protein [Chryseobacterium camelliae]MDQ1100551.1 hypothetical protein [Chryseobacterium sp. SORGH_AS_1048]MDR6087892.1 hypothetical protein [Chryseobacterium sp. SORGH_AS_0909]MDR6132267.1 hypothetical protein [Chryseobacterium sp. SORGH_AS_1175]